MMTSAQAVETSVTTTDNSASQNSTLTRTIRLHYHIPHSLQHHRFKI